MHIDKNSSADDAWAAIQEEKNFPLESPRLQSLTEAHAERICKGYLEQGCTNSNAISDGDEVEPGSDLCTADIREEERYYQRETWAADGESEFVAYPHLTDQGEELRAVRDSQIPLMKMIR